MAIQRPSCFFNLCSSSSSRPNKRRWDCLLPPPRGRLYCRAGLTTPPYSHHWPSHPSTPPHLLLFSGDGRRTSKPSYSSAWETIAEYSLAPCRSLPRPRHRPLPWCSRRGLVNVVNERHPSTVDCTRKIMIPPPGSWDPLEGPLYFTKKTFPPLTCRTHQLYFRTQGSASLLHIKNEYPPC